MDGWSEVDSRDYIFPLEILNIREVPADFCLPVEWTRFEAGLFLPRDCPDWLGRSAYPARILLLSRDKLFALPHPTTREAPAVCGLKEISFVESGQKLLRGWMSFRAPKFDCTTPYSRCGYRPVCRFMRHFRMAWLPDRSLRTVTELSSLEVAFEAGPSWIVPVRAENLESVGEFVHMAYIGV